MARFGLVSAATLACWLTSGYFGAMAVVIAVAFALGVLLTRNAGERRVRFFALTTSSALAGTLVVAALAYAADVGRDAGLNRPVADVYSWGVHLHELVVPAARNFVFGDWTAPFLATRQHGSYPVETTNYLGILTLALAATWLVLAWRRWTALDERKRLATPTFVTVGVIALLLSLPGRVSLLGQTVRMPSWLFWQIVPAFRVPSRWSVVIETALVPLAAFALQEAVFAARRYGSRWKGEALAVGVALLAMVASFLELGLDPTTSRLSMNYEPAEYAAVSRTPQGVLAIYPLLPRLDYLLWQTRHQRPILNTYAFGTAADDAQHALVNPSTPGTAEQLALLDVTAIVTNGDALRWGPAEYPPNPRNWGSGYRLITRTDTGASTWQVVARPGPAFVAAVSGFGPPEALQDGNPAFPLLSSSGVGYFTIRAKEAGTIRLSFDASPRAASGASSALQTTLTNEPSA